MAEKMAPHTRFASLELSNQGKSLSWNNDGILLPAEANPGVVFRRLFASSQSCSRAFPRSSAVSLPLPP